MEGEACPRAGVLYGGGVDPETATCRGEEDDHEGEGGRKGGRGGGGGGKEGEEGHDEDEGKTCEVEQKERK